MKEIWNTLSAIDVGDKIKEKNGLKFLSWAWAWGVLMEHYPDSKYEFDDPVMLPDGSCEIWVTVSVNGLERRMFLPVMDYKNKSIINPNSRDISDTRMRCLTKCLAMFGLGHYIYAGEDIPRESQEVVDTRKKTAEYIGKAIFEQDRDAVKEAWRELTEDEQKALWVAKTKGGYFSQSEKEFIRGSLIEVEV
jgi:hypothetical protein